MSELNSDFQDSIKKYNAKEFDYQDDGLKPQKSYFVGDKLMFLELTHRGEYIEIEEKFIFNIENQSIIYHFARKIEIPINQKTKSTDSLFITNFRKDETEIFVENHLVKTKKGIDNEYFKAIYSVKKNTENSYLENKKDKL